MVPRWVVCLPCLWFAACAAALPSGNEFKPQKNDWPQWQGPQRTAISWETGLLKSWPKDGPPLAWKARSAGDGYSTPSVAAGRLFTMGNRGNKEYVIAFDTEDGRELWATATGRVRNAHRWPRA